MRFQRVAASGFYGMLSVCRTAALFVTQTRCSCFMPFGQKRCVPDLIKLAISCNFFAAISISELFFSFIILSPDTVVAITQMNRQFIGFCTEGDNNILLLSLAEYCS